MSNKNKSKEYVQNLYKAIAKLGDPVGPGQDGPSLVPPKGTKNGACCFKTQQLILRITDYHEDGTPSSWHFEPQMDQDGEAYPPYINCLDGQPWGEEYTEQSCASMYDNNQGPSYECIQSGNCPDGYQWLHVFSVDWTSGKNCSEVDCNKILGPDPSGPINPEAKKETL